MVTKRFTLLFENDWVGVVASQQVYNLLLLHFGIQKKLPVKFKLEGYLLPYLLF